jgi:hypothetical protein
MPKLLFAGFVTLLCLVAAEGLLRLLVPRPGYFPFPEDQPPGLYAPHPERGYTHTPGFDGRIEAREYQISYRINELGLRDDPVADGEQVAVLAAGDSFTVGFGAEAEQAWPAILEAKLAGAGGDPPPRVVNGAYSAYGLVQIRQSVAELISRLKPRVVIVGVYPDGYWRLDDPYTLHKGYVVHSELMSHYDVINEGFIYTPFENPAMQRLHLWMLRWSYFGGLLQEAVFNRLRSEAADDEMEFSIAEKLEPFNQELLRIAQLCQESDVEFVGVLINGQSRDGLFDADELEYNRVIKAFASENGIRIFDPLPEFRRSANGADLRIGDDGHWSRRAHRIAGRELAKFVLEDEALRARLEGR